MRWYFKEQHMSRMYGSRSLRGVALSQLHSQQAPACTLVALWCSRSQPQLLLINLQHVCVCACMCVKEMGQKIRLLYYSCKICKICKTRTFSFSKYCTTVNKSTFGIRNNSLMQNIYLSYLSEYLELTTPKTHHRHHTLYPTLFQTLQLWLHHLPHMWKPIDFATHVTSHYGYLKCNVTEHIIRILSSDGPQTLCVLEVQLREPLYSLDMDCRSGAKYWGVITLWILWECTATWKCCGKLGVNDLPLSLSPTVACVFACFQTDLRRRSKCRRELWRTDSLVGKTSHLKGQEGSLIVDKYAFPSRVKAYSTDLIVYYKNVMIWLYDYKNN